MVNISKSAIFFSGNCNDEMKSDVHGASGITSEALVEKYLGLPTALGWSTDEEFEHILTGIRKLVKVGRRREQAENALEKKWEDIAIPKSAGGMGFRDFQLFNQAMLAKQGRRLISKPDSLCARVLRGKYFHDTDFISARRKRNASHVWKSEMVCGLL